jgi:hypothetical protein
MVSTKASENNGSSSAGFRSPAGFVDAAEQSAPPLDRLSRVTGRYPINSFELAS